MTFAYGSTSIVSYPAFVNASYICSVVAVVFNPRQHRSIYSIVEMPAAANADSAILLLYDTVSMVTVLRLSSISAAVFSFLYSFQYSLFKKYLLALVNNAIFSSASFSDESFFSMYSVSMESCFCIEEILYIAFAVSVPKGNSE